MALASSSRDSLSSRAVPRFDGLDAVQKRLFPNALAEGPKH